MSFSLFDAMDNATVTTNGMPAFKATGSKVLDLFSKIGDSREVDIEHLFVEAANENPELAIRTLLWSRDVRGGAGERKTFRTLLIKLANAVGFKDMKGVVGLIPELGRWDDLLVLIGTQHEELAVAKIREGLLANNGLCAKWMPRKGNVANLLRSYLEMTPKQYRKTLVNLTKVVETQMCAKNWKDIEYSHVPSRAISIYAKAFARNDEYRFATFKNAVDKGEAKVNAGALYPYDLVNKLRNGDAQLSEAQWKALPDFTAGSDEKVLCVVDVSGSMDSRVSSKSNVTCMDVAISLGIYTSERLNGVFKDSIITFTDNPKVIRLTGNLANKVRQCKQDVGYSTNLEAVFDRVLNTAVQYKVDQSEMPDKICILSDMQFNHQVKGYTQTSIDMIRAKYAKAGYEMPTIVYWNIGGSAYGNAPVTEQHFGTAVVSGFSPSILTSILGNVVSPVQVMLDTIGKERYNYLK